MFDSILNTPLESSQGQRQKPNEVLCHIFGNKAEGTCAYQGVRNVRFRKIWCALFS